MNRHEFDAIVVGSGTSAYFAIDGLNRNSRFTIAVIDERPYGGTCALRGCQPKKYLVSNAEAIALTQQLEGHGISKAATTDWRALQELKQEFLQGRSESEVKRWNKRGVATFHGHARMISENEVQVGNDILQGNYIVLATGALPRHTDFEGGELVHQSEFFLELPELPQRVLFIGGGFISFEFAHVAKRAGAREVTIVHHSSRPLKGFDKDIVDMLIKASRAAQINVQLDTAPVCVSKEEDGYHLHTSSAQTYPADLIIEATGRVPNLSVLEGDLGNVEHSAKGVAVNQYLQSKTNQRVYAIGDCAATPYMLAPVADREGQVVAGNILHTNKLTVDYSVIPKALFTIPGVGSVGLTEEQALEQGHDFRVNQGETAGWASSRRIGEKHGAYKIIIDNATGCILGAHIVRHNAAEVINVFALAIKWNIKASDLAEFMWAYPTYTSDLKYMVA